MANGDISTLSSRGGALSMTTFSAVSGGLVSGAPDGVEDGPTLFYVIAAAMRTEDFAFLVYGPRQYL